MANFLEDADLEENLKAAVLEWTPTKELLLSTFRSEKAIGKWAAADLAPKVAHHALHLCLEEFLLLIFVRT